MITDLHPDDTATRRVVLVALRRARTEAGVSRTQLAEAVGSTPAAVAMRERPSVDNPRLEALQVTAEALERRLVLTPRLPVTLPEHPEVSALWAMAAGVADPPSRFAFERSAVLRSMVVYRRWVGIGGPRFAQVFCGGTTGSLSQFELERKSPLLSSFQRYARALGGRLDVVLQPLQEKE